MKRLTNIIIAFVAIFILQSCGIYDNKPPGPGSLLLNQKELEQLFSNKITFISKQKNISVEVINFPDGTVQLFSQDTDIIPNDVGTYRIVNGHKCNTWDATHGGKEKCLKYNKISRKNYYIINTDGSLHDYVTVK